VDGKVELYLPISWGCLPWNGTGTESLSQPLACSSVHLQQSSMKPKLCHNVCSDMSNIVYCAEWMMAISGNGAILISSSYTKVLFDIQATFLFDVNFIVWVGRGRPYCLLLWLILNTLTLFLTKMLILAINSHTLSYCSL